MLCLFGDNFNKINKKANLLYCRTYLGQPVFLAALQILFSALVASGRFRLLTSTLTAISRTIELQSMGQRRTPHSSPRDTRPTIGNAGHPSTPKKDNASALARHSVIIGQGLEKSTRPLLSSSCAQ